MKSSCIRHPEREPLIIFRAWQIAICEGNHCAAGLLSFFGYWHDIKLDQRVKSRQSNDVAERHGDPRAIDESLLQFHSTEELSEGLLGIFGADKIRESLLWLENAGYISVHSNPNPRYKFDRTKFFLLKADALNAWISDYRKSGDRLPENPPRSPENRSRSPENPRWSPENRGAIPEVSAEPTSEPSSGDVSPLSAATQIRGLPANPEKPGGLIGSSPEQTAEFRGRSEKTVGVLSGPVPATPPAPPQAVPQAVPQGAEDEPEEPEEPEEPSRVPNSGSRTYGPEEPVGEARERAERGLGKSKGRKPLKSAYDPAKAPADWNSPNVIGYFHFLFGQKWPGRPLPVALIGDAAQIKSWMEWCEAQKLPAGVTFKKVIDYLFDNWSNGLPKRLHWTDPHPGLALIASRYFETLYGEMSNGGPADHQKKRIDDWDEEAAKKRKAEGREWKAGVWK